MKISEFVHVLKEMGPTWVAWQVAYRTWLRLVTLGGVCWPGRPEILLAQRLGLPVRDVDGWLIEQWRNLRTEFFLADDLSSYRHVVTEPARVTEVAQSALSGKFLLFGRWWATLGESPDWLLNPVTGSRHDRTVHWSRVSDLSEAMGDIKYVWEPSRQAHVYFLARAYAATGDGRYAEGFWRLFESWAATNAVDMGPNWRCGQEAAIRSLAWVFGLYAFKECTATTPGRVALLLEYLWYSALHIERVHWYALHCVRNNHTLSEAAGLFTIGLLFPFFQEADRWRQTGFSHLCSEALWQIYADGTYMQHSMNYSRLVAQMFTWCLRIGQLNGVQFPPKLKERLHRLLRFMAAVQDEETGRVPNYGPTDGSLVFPLSSCDYLDYRPALRALSQAANGPRLYGPGPWDEEAAWFWGPETHVPRPASPPGVGLHGLHTAFPEGGYYVLRAERSFAMLRCGRHRHRPSQADMLHLDLWFKGHNVLVDPGTYSYNPGGGWEAYFLGTGSHNTVTVDGRDQMKKGARFLWYDWVHGESLAFEPLGEGFLFAGQHRGYRPVVHRRLVVQKGDVFLVIDDLLGDKTVRECALHWLVGDFVVKPCAGGAVVLAGEDRLLLRTGSTQPGVGGWARADERARRGWQSLYYGEMLPAWSYRLVVTSALPVTFFTLVAQRGPGEETPAPLQAAEVDELLRSWAIGSMRTVEERSALVAGRCRVSGRVTKGGSTS